MSFHLVCLNLLLLIYQLSLLLRLASISVLSLLNKSTPQIVATFFIQVDPSIRPYWAVSTPDSKRVFVIDQNVPAHVIPIDGKTLFPGTPITTAGIYQDVSISPDLSNVANFTFTKMNDEKKNQTGTVQFDASLSSSPVGRIVQYTWIFGDGDTFIISIPILDHTYQKNRHSVIITLVVTNSAGISTSQVWSSRLMSNFGSFLPRTSKILVLKKEKHQCCNYEYNVIETKKKIKTKQKNNSIFHESHFAVQRSTRQHGKKNFFFIFFF